MKWKSQSGMSLVGVLVAVALVGVLSAGISSLINNALNSQRIIQQKQALFTMQMGLLDLFSDRDLCRINFNNPGLGRSFGVSGNTIDVGNISPIVSADGSTNLLVIGNAYENNTLRLTNLRLMNWRPRVAPSGARAPDEYKGSMDLVFDFERIGATSGMTTLSRRVQLAVELGGYTSGVVGTAREFTLENCVAVGNDTNQPWRVTGSNDIFYDLGNVGIGVENPTHRLQVNGYVLATGYLYPSDARLKRNLTPAPGLSLISKLNPVSYQKIDDETVAFGLIAQEVEAWAPHVVFTDPESGLKSLDYLQLIAPLVASTQELGKRLEANQKKIEAQRAEIENLRRELNRTQ